MSYSYFLITSREIVLFSITYIALLLLKVSYRLIPNLGVYFDYDNSSALYSNNHCTLPHFDFYIFWIYITIHSKQPYKSILMSDYLLGNSKICGIIFWHLGNNMWYIAGWTRGLSREFPMLKVVGSNPTPATNVCWHSLKGEFSKILVRFQLLAFIYGVLAQW